MSTIRNHKWNKEDAILTLYYVKFGLRNLPVKDEKEFAEWIIGSTVNSLTMQSANIRCLLGYNDGVLTDYSKDQEFVVNNYNKLSKDELGKLVNSIIDKRDVNKNIKEGRKKKIQLERKKWEEKSQKDLEEAFRKMGKDPSKMKKIVRTK